VIAVSDGPTDGSDHSIRQIAACAGSLSMSIERRGAALDAVFVLGWGHYVGFLDADGELGPELLVAFVELVGARPPARPQFPAVRTSDGPWYAP